jgi:endonuclease/exonuclease/phosphatase family metal-dependent hydrolase
MHGSARPNLVAVTDAIRSLGSDVIALQEIQRSQARVLARLLGWQQVWARKHYPYSPFVWWRAEGHAILTPHRLSDRMTWTLSRGWSTWTYRYRIMLAATVTRRDGSSLRAYDLHLSSDKIHDETIEQAGRAAGFVRDDRRLREAATTVAVAGDFNDEGIVETVRHFHPLGLVDWGSIPANPAVAPSRRIDHVLVPEESTVVEEHVPDISVAVTPHLPFGWADLSDHLPVTIRFHHTPRSGS